MVGQSMLRNVIRPSLFVISDVWSRPHLREHVDADQARPRHPSIFLRMSWALPSAEDEIAMVSYPDIDAASGS